VNSSCEIQCARSLAPRPSKSLGREEAPDDEHVILSLPVFGRSWLLENSNLLERTRLDPYLFRKFPNGGLLAALPIRRRALPGLRVTSGARP